MVRLNQELETRRGFFSEWEIDSVKFGGYFYTVELEGSGYIDIYLDEIAALNELVSNDTECRVTSFANPRMTDGYEKVWTDFLSLVEKFEADFEKVMKVLGYKYDLDTLEEIKEIVLVSDYDEQEGLYYINALDGTILATYDPETGVSDYSSEKAEYSPSVNKAIMKLSSGGK